MKTYLIASDSFKLVNEEVDKIASQFSNVIKFDYRTDTVKDVITEANYFSLTGEEKCIVFRADNIFKSKKNDVDDSGEEESDDSQIISKYLEHPNELCTIVFTSLEKVDKRKKLFKQISNVGSVNIMPSLNKKDIVYKCMDILKTKGYRIDYETANYIVENSYVNYDIMLSELDKIYALIKPGILTSDLLSDVVSSAEVGNIYDYIAAILNRNLNKAFASSKSFEKMKIDASVVIVTLAKEFEMLYLINTVSNLKDVQNLFHKEDWQMKNYIQNKNVYNIKEIKKAIILLNDYDYKLKSGRVDKDLVLDLIALDFCS